MLFNVLIGLLAVLGAVSILGWVLSALVWLVRLAVAAVALSVVLVLVKVAFRARRDTWRA